MKQIILTGIGALITMQVAAGIKAGCHDASVPVTNPRVKAVMALDPQATALDVRDADEVPYRTLIHEDFSLFTAGSEGSPALKTVNDNMQVIPDSKTLSPGWQGREIHEAGGVAYQGAGGVLFTPDIDLSGNGGEFRVTFRMRVADSSKGAVAQVQHQRISSQYSVRLTGQWQTVTYSFTGGVADDYLAIRAVDPTDPQNSTVTAYIDDIVVEVPDPQVSSPTGIVYDDYDGKSFSLYWDRVNGADSYEIRLSKVDASGNLAQVGDLYTTSVTQYHFDNLESNTPGYAVSVRAVSGSEKSPFSAPVLVEGIPAPADIKVTCTDPSRFTASWSAVPDAYSYEVHTFYEHTAVDDERFYLADTGFDFVKAADQPAEIDVAFSQLPGWFFGGVEFQDGYVGIQGAFSMLGYAAQIESPQVDLSASGGKVTVMFRTKNDDTRTGVVVALFVRERGDYVLVDQLQVSNVTKNWRTVTASLKGGTERSIIAILPTSTGNIYVDDLQVFQNVKEGMKMSRVARTDVTALPEIAVDGLECPEGDDVTVSVRTVGINAAGTRYLYSAWSPKVAVTNPSGVIAPEIAGGAAVTADNGAIVITGAAGKRVGIYTLAGQTVTTAAGEDTVTVTGLANGIYIVKVGAETFKVAL